MFKDWLEILKLIPENNCSARKFICPECGNESIEYIYIGRPITHIGYLPIWCSSCNKGIQISRVEIPNQAKMIDIGDLEKIKSTIPNFKQIAPNT